MDEQGRLIDHPLNQQTIDVGVDELRDLDVLGIAGGQHKMPAILAVLYSGVLNRLIIDETAALAIDGRLENIDNQSTIRR